MDNPFDENAMKILESRYLRRDEDGEIIETPRQMFERVAEAVAEAETDNKELWKNTFFNLMWSKKFLPNSPTLVNAGTQKGSLSACFVMSPDDTMESIMKTAYDAALVEKWGGGIGFGLSKIRPKNDKISTTHGKALGPLGVMRIFAKIGQEITQGSFRLGAHMAMLSVDHPDIREFIHCKDDVRENSELSNFNISVQIPDSFMTAVRTQSQWHLRNPKNGEIVETIRAKDLWDELVESAWQTGDPGLAFMDRVHETAPNPQLGQINSSNPCGEQFLEDYNSCNLGSINLYEHLNQERNDIDWDNLEVSIELAVRFLDNVVDINTFPIPEITEMNRKTRRIGLGVMGWADVLMALEIPYASEEALKLAEKVGSYIRWKAWGTSAMLARLKGAFPEFENSIWMQKNSVPLRNSCVTNTAPTGTISRIAGCSSGIEPHFGLVYQSNVLWQDQEGDTTTLYDSPQSFKDYLKSKHMPDDSIKVYLSLYNKNHPNKEIIEKAHGLDPALINSTALKIPPRGHIQMQAVWQDFCNTNATSKTINLPNDAKIYDVSSAYYYAWETGCKGITVYRQGSRDVEVLTTSKKQKVEKPVMATLESTQWERPKTLESLSTRMTTGHSNMYVTRGYDEGKLREIFLLMGKAGGCESATMEAVARLASIALQYDVPVSVLVKQLSGITCCPIWVDGELVKSPWDALAHLLQEQEIVDKEPKMVPVQDVTVVATLGMACPSCTRDMVNESGCWSCNSCGYSKCG